ncbi:MAG: 3-isopropylmalate dehydratase large subunit [Chloroflexi bacterium]|nr:3-isopropylmalate dehydratase large subunit [Chloroflexota bacterium]
MGKTIAEKILARASGRREVSPGDYIEVSTPCPVTHFVSMGRGPGQMKQMGFNKVFNPRLVNVVDGHNGSTASHRAGEERNAVRAWAKSVGIPEENIYDLGRQGVEHVLAGEKAWAVPGECFFQVVNGHTTTLGALGAFAITLSYGSGAYLMTGKTWIRVPQSVKMVIRGKLPKGVFARDIFEYTLGQIGPSGAVGMVQEWTGPVIEAMDMDGRFALCCNALFSGAWTGIVNPDQRTIEYVRARSKEPFEPLVSDPDAKYAKVYEFDVSNLVPQVVPPPKRYVIKPAVELAGTRVNRGFIGSCAGSRMEDLRLAAQVLKGRKLHPEVILNITPGTVNIFKQALKEGLIETFLDAGCVVPSPACGMCFGANTPLAAGDVCISTGTCNYPGRMGSKDAEIYLGNPATVAASCVEGRITDPRKYL